MSATRPNNGAPRTLLDRVAARAAKVSTLPALPAASAAAAAAAGVNKQPARRPEDLLRMSPHEMAVMELSDTSVRVAPTRRRSLHTWLQGLAVALTFCDAPTLRALDSVSRAVGGLVRVQDCYQRLWRRTQEGRPVPQQHDAMDVALALRAAPHPPTPWKIILARYERELESGWTRYRTTHYQRVVVRYFAERVWGLPMFGMTPLGRSFFMESRYVYAGAVARRWGFEVVLQRQPRDDGEVIAALVRMRPALPQGQQLVCIIAFDALDRAMDVHAQGQPRRRTAYLVTFNITRDSNGAVFSRALLEPAAPDMVFDVEVFVVGPTEASFDEEKLIEALHLPGTVVSDAMRTQLWNLCRNNSNGTVEGGPHSDPLVDDTTRRRKRLLRKFAEPLIRDMGSSCADLAFASCAVLWNFTDVDYPALTPLQVRRAVRCVCKQLIALSEGAAAALRSDFNDKCRAAAEGAIPEEAAVYQYPAPLALARSRDLVRYFTQTPTVIGALWNIATNESRTRLLFDPIDENPLAGLLVSLIERECVHSTYERVSEGQQPTHFPPPLSLVYAATHILTRLQHFILAPRRARDKRGGSSATNDAAAFVVDEHAVMCERWGAVTSPTECVFRFSDSASTPAFPSAAEIAEDPAGVRPFTSTFGDASLASVSYDRIEAAITAAIGFLRYHTVAANDLGVALFGRDFVEFFLPLLRSRSDACVAFASFTFDVSYFPDTIRTPQESHVEADVSSPNL